MSGQTATTDGSRALSERSSRRSSETWSCASSPPFQGETILDAGCGTGLFTSDILASGSIVVGLDQSLPMLHKANRRCASLPFFALAGDMISLPFKDEAFDKSVSVTALEFIGDARAAVAELFRVTRKGGLVVVATLNSDSPWAERRKEEARRKESVFSQAIFRSPRELQALADTPSTAETAIHFGKDVNFEAALAIEQKGRGLATGAFVAVRYQKI